MFFKDSKNKKQNIDFVKIVALLIHAAKIDDNYTIKEEEIIKKTISILGANNENIIDIIQKGKETEKNANQILEFTKEVKNMSNDNKIMIVEALWKIIYSNKEADMYETGLMRKLAGLMYIDNRIMGNIKNKIKNENS